MTTSTNEHISEQSDFSDSDINQAAMTTDKQPETLEKAGITWSIHSNTVQGRISATNTMKKKTGFVAKILDETVFHTNRYAERYLDQKQGSLRDMNAKKLNPHKWIPLGVIT
ncbi:unnamed protein product [Rotaria magnacalcarata]|uniref:Uncharacterized protein n=1 Tax=Rotaria magnacalcarata TaxID=392030 RepID=A0A820EDH6_9BILA|nr:unnamed protein product [Rotaria magnacalcarata]CAF4244754.1 unnamed protein product [Rotaria magnacalcarata]